MTNSGRDMIVLQIYNFLDCRSDLHEDLELVWNSGLSKIYCIRWFLNPF